MFRLPPITNAAQNFSFREGTAIKNKSGIKKGNAKNLNDHETTYSSVYFRPFLLKTSFVDSKKAVKTANIYHTINCRATSSMH